ncbi:MAG: nitroreductase family protein [archaeon]|nr:nitroreductase family protein [archaeon]
MEKILVLSLLICFSSSLKITEFLAEDIIKLPDPVKTGGMPVYQAISERKCQREFVDDEKHDLTLEELSQLLWMAYGPNRSNGYKTVPSAIMSFPFDIYVFLRSGVYNYNPSKHQLELVVARDFRAMTGTQDFVALANVDIVFMGVKAREIYIPDEDTKKILIDWDSGFPAMNMALYCASQGFKCVERAMFVESAILQILGMDASKYYIPLTMSIGK